MALHGDIHGPSSVLRRPHHVRTDPELAIGPVLHWRDLTDAEPSAYRPVNFASGPHVQPVGYCSIRCFKSPEVPIGNCVGMNLVAPGDTGNGRPWQCQMSASL